MSVIQAENLTKKFGDFTAVDNISFRVEAGEIFGFLGPNGAGKSTLLNIIGCLDTPTSGEVIIDGRPADREVISGLPRDREIVVMASRDIPYFRVMDVLDVLRTSGHMRLSLATRPVHN